MSERMNRVNRLIKTQLGPLLEEHTREYAGLVTITHVSVSPDLAQAVVGISCYDTKGKPENIIKSLNKKAHFLYRGLSREIHLKRIPKLIFKLDTSGDHIEQLDKLFYEIRQEKDFAESSSHIPE